MPARNDFAPGEFCWIDLSAKDLESAGRWYSETFGWRLQMMETPGGGPPYGFFMKGDAAVAGIGELTPEMQLELDERDSMFALNEYYVKFYILKLFFMNLCKFLFSRYNATFL